MGTAPTMVTTTALTARTMAMTTAQKSLATTNQANTRMKEKRMSSAR